MLSEMAFGGVNISNYNFDEFEIYLDFKQLPVPFLTLLHPNS